MLVNGDNLVATKNVAGILNEGDVVVVTNVSENGVITFLFGDDLTHTGIMSSDEYKTYFELLDEDTHMTTSEYIENTTEYIENIIENSEYSVHTVFDKCTIVACKLPNGFIIVESSVCVSPDNYDEEAEINICLDKIENKIWELESYKFQDNLYNSNNKNVNCYDCYHDECHCTDMCDGCEGCEECAYDDSDCDDCRDCRDCECEFNPNR